MRYFPNGLFACCRRYHIHLVTRQQVPRIDLDPNNVDEMKQNYQKMIKMMQDEASINYGTTMVHYNDNQIDPFKTLNYFTYKTYFDKSFDENKVVHDCKSLFEIVHPMLSNQDVDGLKQYVTEDCLDQIMKFFQHLKEEQFSLLGNLKSIENATLNRIRVKGLEFDCVTQISVQVTFVYWVVCYNDQV